MAFDGITVSCLVKELNDKLKGGRLYKIAQTESDELQFIIKVEKNQYRLLLSANASLPLVYLTEKSKPAPITAPNFCMLLRKHLNNGRIVSVTQPGLERIIHINVEHFDEMGDLKKKVLIVELMGKHSNIIFCDESMRIIDSIKHVSAMMSSVREVLPGRDYFIPDTMKKQDPLSTDEQACMTVLKGKNIPLFKAIYTSFTGLSPIMAEEICHKAGADSSLPAAELDEDILFHIARTFCYLMEDVKEAHFTPTLYLKHDIPDEYSALPLTVRRDDAAVSYDSMSRLLEEYYAKKNQATRIRQKSYDLRKIVTTALERDQKKYDLQLRQLEDTKKREQYQIYGELLTTYSYQIEEGVGKATVNNYYTGEDITIPLDPALTAMQNAQKYYDKYGKLKRTYEALSSIIKETEDSIEHLESINTALDIAVSENDLTQIKEELISFGYIRRKGGGKPPKIVSKPFHYLSSDGFHIYVGKNNYQNENLTFQVASGNDWWFHAKGIPGSHVIVKAEGKELPDRTFEDAGRLAAYYSKGRNQEKVNVDYIQKKQIKKTPGGKPGFVIYHTNYSFAIRPDISGITLISD